MTAQVRTLLQGLQETGNVLYAQRQSNSLAEEFSQLLPDVGTMPAVAEAFACLPEALNLWIGEHSRQKNDSPKFSAAFFLLLFKNGI